jgi:KDO2-lipid IV(A) lauroyltransferase
MTAKDRAVEWGYAAGWRIVRALPQRIAAGLFRAGADRATRKRAVGAQRLKVNLRQVVGPEMSEPDLDLLVRDGMRSYARYWMEAFRLPSRSAAQHRGGFVLHGIETLKAACDAGQGIVLALPHAGNWDAAGAHVVSTGLPVTTVAERLKPESLYRRFLAYRESLGMEILPLTGGERPTLDVLAERVSAGVIVPLLADRDFSARGVEVNFFGRRTKMPAGPAILALRTGAPLHVVHMWYGASGPEGQVSDEIVPPDPASGALDDRVRRLTQAVADEIARGVARHPADWHMLSKMWVTGRDRKAAEVGGV